MVQIVLIRPGSTDYDQQRRIQGNLDVPLNEQGAAEVARMIEPLRGQNIEVIYAACCEPAMQTGQAIAQALDVKLRKLDRMQNLNHGLWQGMLIEEVRLKQPKVYRQWQEQPELICPPEGEMLSQADERVEQAMTKLAETAQGRGDRVGGPRAAGQSRPPFRQSQRTGRPLESDRRARPVGSPDRGARNGRP